MKYIKSVTVIDPRSSFNNQVVDILIEKGVITKIATSIKILINSKNWF